MKTYWLILIGIWMISCGNSTSQSRNSSSQNSVTQDTIMQEASVKDTVVQDTVAQDRSKINSKETLDAILHACSEKACLIYKKDYRPKLHDFALASYDDEFIAFFDTMEKVYQPYKERLMATITELPTEDMTYDPYFQIEFARDTLCLHASYFLHGYPGGHFEHSVCQKYYYVQLRKLIDKYYNILFDEANSQARVWVPKVHKQWLNLLENDLKMSGQLEYQSRYYSLIPQIFDMMEQRLIFYYHCIQSNTPDEY